MKTWLLIAGLLLLAAPPAIEGRPPVHVYHGTWAVAQAEPLTPAPAETLTPDPEPVETPAAEPTPGGPPEYVGFPTCLACHQAFTPEIEAGMMDSIHGKVLFEEDRPPGMQGCESCHGPGSDHAWNKAGTLEPGSMGIDPKAPDPVQRYVNWEGTLDGPNPVSGIVNPRRLKPQKVTETCMKCHWKGVHKQDWMGGKHAQAGLTCTNCHNPHKATKNYRMLLKPSVTETCLSCHQDQRHRFTLTSHHPVLEGRLKCTDCHNPHGSGNERLQHQAGNQLCLTCHVQYEGPFAVEHPAVVSGFNNGCLNCHLPHGSPNRRLLVATDRGTCLQCHSDRDRKQHNLGFNCLTCHPFIHGSNSDAVPPFSQP